MNQIDDYIAYYFVLSNAQKPTKVGTSSRIMNLGQGFLFDFFYLYKEQKNYQIYTHNNSIFRPFNLSI